MKKIKLENILIYVIVLNILLIILRLRVDNYLTFPGDLLSTSIFIIILATLIYLFFAKKYDYFILIWLSFHFACLIIKLPFTDIGSLGILNAIFLPLMILKSFDFKNKYFITILTLLIITILNVSDVSIRIIISNIFELISPFIFFYFVTKKCQNPEFIIKGGIIIALMSLPLAAYQIIAHPAGGVFQDWRGFRIFGNLFWPNSYAIYLLAPTLTSYFLMRKSFSKYKLIIFLLLVLADVFTFSRIGLLVLVAGITLFEILYIKKNAIAKRITIFFIILGLFIIYSFYLANLSPRFTTESLEERTVIWESVLPFIKNSFVFGNGVGSYEIYRDQIIQSLSPHNYYLDIIFEIGIVGLGVILIFLFFIAKDFFKQSKIKNNRDYNKLGLALLFALMLASFVGSAFSQVSALNAWIFLGCFMTYTKMEKEAKK